MLTSITAPTTSNLMAPETVLARLNLAAGELADIEDQVAEASGLVTRYLGFRPEYGTWQETFDQVNDVRLDLGARPAWSISSITYRDGTVQAADGYRLLRGPNGESMILRAGALPWGYYTDLQMHAFLGPSVQIGGFWVSVPDWTVVYLAGWWLEEMTGTMPAGVETFPAELQGDFLRIVRWLRATNSSNSAVRRMKDDGAEVEFFGAADQDIDPRSGIPNACLRSLVYYRRA